MFWIQSIQMPVYQDCYSTFISWARAASSSIVGREGLGSPPSPVNSCRFLQMSVSCVKFPQAPGLPSWRPSGHLAPWWGELGCGRSWSHSWWPPPESAARAGPSDQGRFPPPGVQFVEDLIMSGVILWWILLSPQILRIGKLSLTNEKICYTINHSVRIALHLKPACSQACLSNLKGNRIKNDLVNVRQRKLGQLHPHHVSQVVQGPRQNLRGVSDRMVGMSWRNQWDWVEMR